MKARLKTIILSALGAISSFGAVTYSSCEPDKCKSIVCAYGGVCKEGTCICPTGYEGFQCETITRKKFQGNWTVMEKGTKSMPANYSLVIEYGENMTDMTITNFYNKFTTPINVRVKGDTMFIPQQPVEGYEILGGKGYLTGEGHYSQNGQMMVFYSIKMPDGKINDFGINAGDVSVWNR
jgi:hypothetical protein